MIGDATSERDPAGIARQSRRDATRRSRPSSSWSSSPWGASGWGQLEDRGPVSMPMRRWYGGNVDRDIFVAALADAG